MEGPIKRRRIRRRTLRNSILAGIVLVVVVAGFYGIQQYLASGAMAEHAAQVEAAETTAARISSMIEAAIRQPLAKVQALAENDEIKALFADSNKAALEQAAASHGSDIPHLLKLRFLLPGSIELEPDAAPPLSYASLDLLNQARNSGAAPGIELHMPGTEHAHVVIVRRVTSDGGDLVGLVHASLSTDLLQETLTRLDNANGYLELKQFIGGGAPVTLVARGDKAYKSGQISKTAPVSHTSWALTYWPPVATAGVAGRSGGSFMPVAVILILLLAGSAGWVVWRRRRGSGGENEAVYDGALKAFMEGAHPELGKLVPNMPASRKKAKPAAEPAVPDARADITRVARPEEAEEAVAAAAGQAQQAPAKARAPANEQEAAAKQPPAAEVPAGIFRAYDIRGLVDSELTPAVVELLGRSIGSEARDHNQRGIVVGRDGRLSSPVLSEALIKGLRSAGLDVIDIGLVATPVLYFATHYLEAKSGVMITGSHNGPEYNGLKVVIDGDTLSGKTVKALHQRIRDNNFSSGNGSLQTADITADYVRRVTEDIPAALGNAYNIVVDCGNGAASKIAPQVYKAMGHDVVELFCEIDGNFPNHHPDPSQPQNLEALIAKVKETGADLGFAFDGDGDRLGVVDGEGNIIWPDRQLMLLARDVLSRNAGAPIIFDVKCSRYLKAIIQSAGGKPLMWKTGHSLIKGKMKEVEAPLAGEMSGHIFFKERWYGFDDAIYTGARMLEVLAKTKDKPTAVFAELPNGVSTPELRIPLPEKRHGEVMQALRGNLSADDGELIDVDGLRIDYADGWGLIRPSNTSPFLVARFEAEDQAVLERIQGTFRSALQAVDPALKPPF